MSGEASIQLRKDLARHLRAGHPWVFKRAIDRPPKLPAGTIVDVESEGHFVARGYYDPASAISVRVLTREPGEAIDAAFWRRRVARAVALRRELVRDTTGYRLVHGESDGLPGVVADRYDHTAVLKLYSAGLTPGAARSSRRCAPSRRGSPASTAGTRSRGTTTTTAAHRPAASSGGPSRRSGSSSTSTG